MDRPRVPELVCVKIEQMVLEGALSPGERLPAERQLADRLGVSRPSLREALRILSTRGILRSERSGGTYVTEKLNPTLEDPLLELISNAPESHADVLELRHAIESLAASLAAERHTATDKDMLRATYKRLIESHRLSDPTLEARADADFHLAIGEASHNVVLLHVMRSLFSLLKKSIRFNLENLYTHAGMFEQVRDQHYHLLTAILDGDPAGARAASERHIDQVEKTLFRLDITRQREAQSNRREIGFSHS
jgi:DNA-binding FadR family transcriptional regulator